MTPDPTPGRPILTCSLCAELADVVTACQKYGWAENDTGLPSAAGRLELVRDLRPLGSRELKLMRCPECGDYFLYETDYEYLVNGSEDEQRLIRLPPEQAAQYLSSPPGMPA